MAAIIQSANGQGSATFTTPTTAGNPIVVMCASDTVLGGVPSISDDGGNLYLSDSNTPSGNGTVSVGCLWTRTTVSPSSASTVTSTDPNLWIWIYELDRTCEGACFIDHNEAPGTASPSSTPSGSGLFLTSSCATSASPTAGDVYVCFAAISVGHYGRTVLSASAPWVLDTVQGGNAVAYLITPSLNSTQTVQFTLDGSSDFAIIEDAFEAVQGGTTPTPDISGITRTCGDVGDSVVISGTNFGTTQGSSTVTFNGVSATATSWSDTSITVTVPTGATSGTLLVTVGGNDSNGVIFNIPCPLITSLDASCNTSYQTLTINGSNFGSSQGAVFTGGFEATIISWTDTQITVELGLITSDGVGVVVNTTTGDSVTYGAYAVTSPIGMQLISPARFTTGQIVDPWGGGTSAPGASFSMGAIDFPTSQDRILIQTQGTYAIGCGVSLPDLTNSATSTWPASGFPNCDLELLINGVVVASGSGTIDVLTTVACNVGDYIQVRVASGAGSHFRLWAVQITDGTSAALTDGADDMVTCNGLFSPFSKTAMPVPSGTAVGVTSNPQGNGLAIPVDGQLYLIQGTLSQPGDTLPCNMDPGVQLTAVVGTDNLSSSGPNGITLGGTQAYGASPTPGPCPPCTHTICGRNVAPVPALAYDFAVVALGMKTIVGPTTFVTAVYFPCNTGLNCIMPGDVNGVADILVTAGNVHVTRLTNPDCTVTPGCSGFGGLQLTATRSGQDIIGPPKQFNFAKYAYVNQIFEVDPSTNAAFVPAGLDATEFGYLTESCPPNPIRITQLAVEVMEAGGILFRDMIQSPFFEASVESNAPEGVPAHGGNNNLLIRLKPGVTIPNDGQYYGMRVLSAATPVPKGGEFAYGGWIRWDVNPTAYFPLNVLGFIRIGVRFYDANWNLLQDNGIDFISGSGAGVDPMSVIAPNLLVNGYVNQYSGPTLSSANYNGPIGPAVVPTGAAWVRFNCCAFVQNQSASPFSTGSLLYLDARFDDCFCVSLTDPTNQLKNKGSIVPSYSGTIDYLSTSNSITWQWTGLVVYRTDGTSVAIPDGTYAVTGLASASSYCFFPYWDEDLQKVDFVVGGVGSPSAAFANAPTAVYFSQAQNQFLQNHVPLSTGLLTAATTGGIVELPFIHPTTTISGGGTGGGAGRVCLRKSMIVMSKIRGPLEICEVQEGEEILGRTDWTKVVRKIVAPNSTWIRLRLDGGEMIDATPTHPFTLLDLDTGGDITKRAMDLCMSDMMYIRTGVANLKSIEHIEEDDYKVTLSCEPEHEFYAGFRSPDILTHNMIIGS